MANQAAAAADAAATAGSQVASTTAEQGKEVAATAVDEAKQVASQAMEQASAVAGEAKEHARQLLEQARTDVRSQADQQTERIAESLRGLAGQFQALLEGRADEAGPLPDLARQATDQLQSLAGRIGDGGFDGVVQEAQRFARRRPGLFLAGAATLGFVGGRLLRGVQAAQQQGIGQQPQTALPQAPLGSPAPVPGATDSTDVILLTDQAAQEGGPVPMPVGSGSPTGVRP